VDLAAVTMKNNIFLDSNPSSAEVHKRSDEMGYLLP
jgi:hypothetical protein